MSSAKSKREVMTIGEFVERFNFKLAHKMILEEQEQWDSDQVLQKELDECLALLSPHDRELFEKLIADKEGA